MHFAHCDIDYYNGLTIISHVTVTPLCIQGGLPKDMREVKQFHFTTWPDHGVPEFPTAMLAMIRCVRAHHDMQLDTGPMVVHCSAGVGRTGTFIVIDTMLQRILHGEQSIDILCSCNTTEEPEELYGANRGTVIM